MTGQACSLQLLLSEANRIHSHDVYFFDDVELLSQIWTTANSENVGELLTGFFQFFGKQFDYASRVISIRSDHGSLPKDVKGWHTLEVGRGMLLPYTS